MTCKRDCEHFPYDDCIVDDISITEIHRQDMFDRAIVASSIPVEKLNENKLRSEKFKEKYYGNKEFRDSVKKRNAEYLRNRIKNDAEFRERTRQKRHERYLRDKEKKYGTCEQVST